MNYIQNCLGCLLFCFLLSGVNAVQKNVLFIAVDDLKPLLSAYGSSVPTPNIDRIADQGTVFSNAHCQQAVCGPSRASLLTGRYPDFTKIWDLKTKIRKINPEIVTLPQYFKIHGYHSTGVGKIFDPRSVDKGADQISWSEPYKQTWHLKHDAGTGKPTLHYHNKISRELAHQAEAEGKKSWNELDQWLSAHQAKPYVEAEPVPDTAYNDGAIAAYAVQKLKALSKIDQPFFFAVGFKKPHLPFVAPKKYWDLFDRDSIELAPYQDVAKNSPEFAYHDWSELRPYSGIPESGPLPEEAQRDLLHGYYACVAYIDAQIGKLLDQLQNLKLSKNTIVVLFGDHGWHLGDHAMWCKHSNFENATRVPLLLSAPDGIRGQKTNMPAELTDLFPTLCALAGLEIPSNLDGMSLAPTIMLADESVREFAVSQYPRGSLMGYALRNDRFRYVSWFQTGGVGAEGSSQSVATELYDYQIDPLEKMNHSKTPAFREVESQLSAQLKSFLNAR